ncbi:hypothetical protein [Actinoplanes sp. NPDC049681]|uniref:hypothetical protein n=1 Tax=Actinoplanes sp. NPDC049681 TaxID=3363905 RepID=UPI0037A3B067
MIIGVIVTAVLIAVTYFGVVSTTKAEAAELASETEERQAQTIDLRKRVAKLADEKKNEKSLTATRDTYRDALPSGSGVPAFLRQLQASGTSLDVDVSGISVGIPSELKALPGVWSIQIQLSAEGAVDNLSAFLDSLQGSGQKRAVLIQTANLEVSAEGGTRLSLTVSAFVAPPAGSGAPAVTTD